MDKTAFPDGIEALDQANQDQHSGASDCTNDVPLPLMRQIYEPEPFPLDALGPILSAAAKRIQEVVQAPDAICGQSILAASAMAVQGYGNVLIDGRISPTSLNLLSIAESGERKSAVDSLALKSVRDYERQLSDEYQNYWAEYQDQMEVYESERKRAISHKSKEEKEFELTSLGKRPEQPLSPFLLLSDPTFEGLTKLLACGQPAVGLFSDEGGKFFGGHGMTDEQQLKTAAGLSSLWDGKAIDRIRAGDGASKLYGRRLSCHLMIQPVVAEQLLSNQVLTKQGFLARCLVCHPKSTAGTRSYHEVNLDSDPTINRFHSRIADILRTPFPLEEGKKNELKPRPVILAGKVKDHWISFHNSVEKNLAEPGDFVPIRAFGSKAAEQCARIAGVLTLVNDIDAGEISIAALESAIELTTHYLGEALRLAEQAVIDPGLFAAQRLLEWLNGKEYIDLPRIYQSGPRNIRNKKEALHAVKVLEEHRWLKRIPQGMMIEGKRRREVWSVYRGP